MGEIFDHGSSENLIRHIKDRSDDIDAIWILMDNAVIITGSEGATIRKNTAGAIEYCAGSPSLIHAVDLELLLNDSGIRSLRIPFRLLMAGQSLPEK